MLVVERFFLALAFCYPLKTLCLSECPYIVQGALKSCKKSHSEFCISAVTATTFPLLLPLKCCKIKS